MDKISVKISKIKIQLKEELETVKFFYERHITKFDKKEKQEVQRVIERAEMALDEEEPDTLEAVLSRIQALRNRINSILISEFED